MPKVFLAKYKKEVAATREEEAAAAAAEECRARLLDTGRNDCHVVPVTLFTELVSCGLITDLDVAIKWVCDVIIFDRKGTNIEDLE